MGVATEIRTLVVLGNPSEWVKAASFTPVAQLPREITPGIAATRSLPALDADSGAWLQRGLVTIQASHNAAQQGTDRPGDFAGHKLFCMSVLPTILETEHCCRGQDFRS